MSLKATAWLAAAAVLAGALGGAWLARQPLAPPPAPKQSELGEKTPADAATTYVPADVATTAAQMTPEQAAAFLDRFAGPLLEAYRRGLAAGGATRQVAPGRDDTARASDHRGTAFPRASAPAALPGLPEIAAALASGEAKKLAERTIGPGPLGDSADVAAVVLCNGCPTELVADWHPATPPPPLAGVDVDTAYGRGFAELAPGFDEFLNAELAGGWSHLRGSERGRFLHQTYVEIGYGLGKKAFVGAGWRGDLVLRHRKKE